MQPLCEGRRLKVFWRSLSSHSLVLISPPNMHSITPLALFSIESTLSSFMFPLRKQQPRNRKKKIKIPFTLTDSFRYDFTQELAASWFHISPSKTRTGAGLGARSFSNVPGWARASHPEKYNSRMAALNPISPFQKPIEEAHPILWVPQSADRSPKRNPQMRQSWTSAQKREAGPREGSGMAVVTQQGSSIQCPHSGLST